MLRSLTIRNFAVIEEIQLEFSQGLCVFTGQTGAGKSILIEALGFLLGVRGSQQWLRTGSQRLEVTGTFDSADVPTAVRAAMKIEGPAVTLRRELDSAGKTRAFVGNKSVSVAVLAELGDGLVDFHGQHEHQTLLKPALQLDLLDAFGGSMPLREKVSQAWSRWSRLAEEERSLQLSDEERLRRLDLYRFQLGEIEESALRQGEEEELEAMLPRLKNAERIRSMTEQAYGVLYEQEGSVQEYLLKAERALEELTRLDPALEPIRDGLVQARATVQDVSSHLAGYRDRLSLPGGIDDVLSRLDRIGRLKKKYGSTVQDVLAYRDKIKTELSWLEDSSARTQELEQQLSQAHKAMTSLNAKIHKERMAAGVRLSEKVSAELKGLGMLQSRFSVSVEMEELRSGPAGSDEVEFLIAPNPGEPLKALKAVASGGELSRVMLALKTVLARNDCVRILVFDEVDAGVGGEVGMAVGRRLSELGRSHQVLCVTHLPQVACFAQRHFHVEKEVSKGRTYARVQVLDSDKRVEAVARMLAGKESTATSLRHAKELLEECRA